MKIDMNKIYALATSADFRARLKAEYWQLKDRYEKLSAMIAKYEAGKLDFEPLCPLGILKEQRSLMLGLMCVLQRRAAIENVELNEDDVTLTEEPTKDLQEGELVAVHSGTLYHVGLIRSISPNDKGAWVRLRKGSIERCSDTVMHYYALSELHHIANSDAIRMV